MLKTTVKTMRLARGLTQADLARLAGVSQTTIADIERGRNESSKALPDIARALGCTVEEILSPVLAARDVQQPRAAYSVGATSQELSLLDLFKSLTSTQQKSMLAAISKQVRENENLLSELMIRRQDSKN